MEWQILLCHSVWAHNGVITIDNERLSMGIESGLDQADGLGPFLGLPPVIRGAIAAHITAQRRTAGQSRSKRPFETGALSHA